MPRKTSFLVSLLLLAAGAASAQTGAKPAPWSAWQSATAPDGAALSSVQYRWRSAQPCTPAGCQLSVQLRNNATDPAEFHYSIYAEGAAKPIAGDASLKSFAGAKSGTAAGGDTASRTMPGAKIARVVVEMKSSSAAGGTGGNTWGPYHYSLVFAGNDLTPDATMEIHETLQITGGVVTVTEQRDAGSVDPIRTPGLGKVTHSCTPQSAKIDGTRIDDGNGEVYIPAPLWEVQLTCAEGPVTALFPSEKNATAFIDLINSGAKKQ